MWVSFKTEELRWGSPTATPPLAPLDFAPSCPSVGKGTFFFEINAFKPTHCAGLLVAVCISGFPAFAENDGIGNAFDQWPRRRPCHPRWKAGVHSYAVLLPLSPPTALGGSAFFLLSRHKDLNNAQNTLYLTTWALFFVFQKYYKPMKAE